MEEAKMAEQKIMTYDAQRYYDEKIKFVQHDNSYFVKWVCQ